jgi:hypothetical protein
MDTATYVPYLTFSKFPPYEKVKKKAFLHDRSSPLVNRARRELRVHQHWDQVYMPCNAMVESFESAMSLLRYHKHTWKVLVTSLGRTL